MTPARLTVMVEKVGGGYVPIVGYTPGNDRQREQADNLVQVLHALAGIGAHVETTEADQ